MKLTIGQEVVFNCIEGFGGDAVVVDIRNEGDSHYKVKLTEGVNHYQTCWAYDAELSLPADPKTDDDVVRSTARHIRRVGRLLAQCIGNLADRAVSHDASKWCEAEWPAFKDATPRLANLTYGSDEYKASLRSIKPAIDHHNMVNRHHPEHHKDGIDGMTLLDLVEMLADWKAATERHHDGSLNKSFEHNKERFKMSDQLVRILENTAKDMGWLT